ncbi:restin homolog [Amphibalanus amphitrite]|uniref:restin homolog n=1 Tax=Amphibalanus amphitrite TaxID=1232801 RepID=UPI001C91A2CF|nr:restin homolog [Amphibalanus amphitrite]
MDDYESLRRLSEAGVARRFSTDTVLTRDTDSFMVGELVFVGGTLPGKIAYIGETKFGGGDWAGVVLEKPFGKHDGTVGGHQYFQCEPRHGVFSRLTRLSREPLGSPPPEWHAPSTSAGGGSPSRRSSQASADGGADSRPGSRRTSRSSPVATLPTGARRSSSPAKAPPSPARRSSSPSFTVPTPARCGDRVSVSSSVIGRRLGTVRYVGHAEFADGVWVGIQLDEPRGRNDGSVAGKRYFECEPDYGLFAPLNRVTVVQRRISASRDHVGADVDGFY